MRIVSLQKLTLLDYPGKTACTVFTPGCDFRCPFCHNASLVLAAAAGEPLPSVDEEEVLAYLEKRTGLIDGVCITGGEPLMQPDLPVFLRQIRTRAPRTAIKLDTNGSFPERLAALLDEGLVDYVAMDIKAGLANYARAAGIAPERFDLAAIERSVELLRYGTVAYEFRTTVVDGLHTAADFEAIAQWLAGVPRYFLQQYTDSGEIIANVAARATASDSDCGENVFSSPSAETMRVYLDIVAPTIPAAALRGIE